jgi:hypothetical protein
VIPASASEPPVSGTRKRISRARSPSQDDIIRIRFELADKYAAGDYMTALTLAEELQRKVPDDIAADSFARDCRSQVEAAALARIGSLQNVPVLAVSPDELQKRSLDHRAGFLLSQLDGQSSIEDLLDVVGMPRAEAFRILAQLIEAGIVRLLSER